MKINLSQDYDYEKQQVHLPPVKTFGNVIDLSSDRKRLEENKRFALQRESAVSVQSWNWHYTLPKLCTSQQLYFKHKGLWEKNQARFSFGKVMHLLLLLWKSKLKTHEQTNTTFTQFFFYLIKKKRFPSAREKKALYNSTSEISGRFKSLWFWRLLLWM